MSTKTKTCSKCKEEKPIEDFPRHKSKKDGRHGHCKECVAVSRKDYYFNRGGKEKLAEYRENNREAIRARSREWGSNNRDKRREYKLNNKYGITQSAHDELLREQGGVCAICRRPPTSKRLGVDHDHTCCPGEKSCGKCVRGLLCDSCNQGIGFFGDDVSILQSAIQYLSERKIER